MKYIKNHAIIIIFSIVIFVFSASLVQKSFQNDTFFTIASGNKILSEGFYEDETFTWHEGLKYPNVRWIFDTITASMYNKFGFLGIYVFVMFMAGITGDIIFFVFINKKVNVYMSFLYSIAMIFLIELFFAARGQIISIPIFILEYYFLNALLEKKQKRYIILIFILAVLLANAHASVFPMFFVIMAPYIAEIIVSKAKFIHFENTRIKVETYAGSKYLIIAFVISLFAGLIAPNHYIAYTDLFYTVGSISSDFIAEMESLVVADEPFFVVMITIFISILLFFNNKIKLSDFLYIFGFTILTISTLRSILYFFIFAGFSLAMMVNEVIEDRNLFSSVNNKSVKIVFTFLSIYIFVFSLNNFTSRIHVSYTNKDFCPVEVCDYILSELDTTNMKLYNTFGTGAYIEFRGIKCFMDSRAEIYLDRFNDTKVFSDMVELTNNPYYYETIFGRYGVTHVLIGRTDEMVRYMAEDENYILFKRNVEEKV